MLTKNVALSEAKKLYRKGFAIHWLKPLSKAPVENGWTTGPRKPLEYLEQTYFDGLNVGVRLGEASKIGDGFLACIDVDVKDPAFKKAALSKLHEITNGREKEFPTVYSGSGSGSRHLYFTSKEPFKMKTAAKVKDKWEIAIYSSGRQMVLPPSIHPETKKPYQWAMDAKNFPLFDVSGIESVTAKREASGPVTARAASGGAEFKFKLVEIDLNKTKVSERIKSAVFTGEGVKDRSGFLLPASSAMLKAGLSVDEILSVLTDRETFLGKCAYDHAKTDDRERAAFWVWRYTLERVVNENDVKRVFGAMPIEEPVLLSDEERTAQDEEFSKIIGWTKWLERTKDFKVRGTMKNCKIIFENVFGKDCFRFNEFSMNEEMHGAFPWCDKFGKEVYDVDVTMAKDWFAKTWGFEPPDEKIRSAISVIAFENRFHPVRAWLKSLPAWDEVERADALLSKYIPCAGDSELKAVCGRRFLVSLVRRIFEPGCQSDQLLILEGNQGIFKSSAFRALVGDEWFSDAAFNVEDKDAVMVIFSKWLIEFGELSTLDKTTAEHTKAFITRRSDRIRAPFDRKAKDYPRQCVFVGSTNREEYLKDDTGNRRYWPFKVTSFCRVEEIARDRAQLFAEALYYYECGEVTYLKEPHLVSKMANVQSSKEVHDIVVEQVEAVISSEEKRIGKPFDNFKVLELTTAAARVGIKLENVSVHRLGAALRKLGFVLSHVWKDGRKARVWGRVSGHQ